MSPDNTVTKDSKFTKGEKCIFAHLIVTFAVLLILVIIYCVHLYLVGHSVQSALSTRRSGSHIEFKSETYPVGLIYLSSAPEKSICCTLLLNGRWSVSPGHCAALRSNPDLAHLLEDWRIKYKTENSVYFETDIIKSFPHPNFNREDFSNNIGVLQHEISIEKFNYVFPVGVTLNDKTLRKYANDMVIIGWKHDLKRHGGGSQDTKEYSVKPVNLKKCQQFVEPVVDLRSYEFCVIAGDNIDAPIDHGAVLVIDSKIQGIFSWGEREGKGFPFIIINLMHYQEWLEHVISL